MHLFPTLPPSLKYLAFEMDWNEPTGWTDCLEGLESPEFRKGLEELTNLKEVLFMPHYLRQKIEPPMANVIREHLTSLDARGILRIATLCEQLEGCQYEEWEGRHARMIRGSTVAFAHPKLIHLRWE